MAIDRAGNTLNRAKNIGLVSTAARFKDQIGQRDAHDFLRFKLSGRSSVNLSLNNLKADANLRLLNKSGRSLQASAEAGKGAEAIKTTLNAGTYFVQVSSGASAAKTSYSLKIASSTPASTSAVSVSSTSHSLFVSAAEHHTVAPAYPSETKVDDGSTIDLMVVYTPKTRATEGGMDAINKAIKASVQQINEGYANSGIIPRIRLVHTSEVNYVESGIGNTDLTRLSGKSDGYMDEVHAMRDAYGADIVSLFVDSADVAGTAYVMSNVSHDFEALAFNVVQTQAAKTRYTLGHEIGHNLGAEHDHSHAHNDVAYDYAYGYVNASGAGDVMSYAQDRRNYYSSPDIIVNDQPLGREGQEDIVRAFNNVSLTAANWRKSVVANSSVPRIAIGATDVEGAEKPDAPTNSGKFTLTRSGSTASAFTVSYKLSGTATQGVDYSALNGTITFAAGSSIATLAINPLNDNVVESSETVIVTLSASSTYYLDAAAQAIVTIADAPRTTASVISLFQ